MEKQGKQEQAKQDKTKKKKLKLNATLREQKHYLAIIDEKSKMDEKEMREMTEKAILDYIGILGFSEAGAMIVKVERTKDKSYLILSSTTKFVDKIKSALILQNKGLRCVGVSGTLKKLERFLK
jgi:RNase P/RNase MRP subunit POP5